MGYVDAKTMLEFKDKTLRKIEDSIEDALTSNLVNYTSTSLLTIPVSKRI